jgi:hypothetical protein
VSSTGFDIVIPLGQFFGFRFLVSGVGLGTV